MTIANIELHVTNSAEIFHQKYAFTGIISTNKLHEHFIHDIKNRYLENKSLYNQIKRRMVLETNL